MDFIKSPKSAIVVIPKVSDVLWQSIQNVRRENDKAYERWMPHINLIFPFIERPCDDFGQEVLLIRKCFQECDVKRFKMKFCPQSVGFFEMKKNFTMWLKPLPLSVPQVIHTPRSTPETNKVQSLKCIQKDEAIEKGRKKECCDNEWIDKYCVDPFGTFDQHDMQVSLFDLHCDANFSDGNSAASLINFAKKSYATWGDVIRNIAGGTEKEKEKMEAESDSLQQLYLEQKEVAETCLQDLLDERFQDDELSRVKKLPHLMRLQASLRRAFPKCDDLDSISSSGFQPHLTLGQFKKRNIEAVVENLQNDLFKGAEEFTVDSIHIITRHSYEEKFEIRATIDLP